MFEAAFVKKFNYLGFEIVRNVGSEKCDIRTTTVSTVCGLHWSVCVCLQEDV